MLDNGACTPISVLKDINVSTESARNPQVSKNQNGFMKTSFIPKTNAIILTLLDARGEGGT